MSDSHHSHAGSADTTVLVEPDDVPTGMLTKLAVAVTIVVVAAVVFINMVFDSTLADELSAKGYSEAAVPSENSGARTW